MAERLGFEPRGPSLQELDEAVTCIDSLVRVAGA